MDLLHGFTVGDVLREHRRSFPQRTALVCGDDRVTWPEFDDRVNRLAGSLLSDGFGPGDRILWLGQNCHRVLEGLLAVAKLGGIFCPVNWRQSADELAFVIEDVDPHLVIWQETEIGPTVREARDKSGSKARWLQHDAPAGAADSYEGYLARAGEAGDPGRAVDPATPLLMLYTAAFSGRPNGALLSHTAAVVQDLMMAMLQEITSEYVYLNSGPLFHVATLMTTLATFHMGGTNVFTRRVDAEELCRLIDAESCTGAFLLPPTTDQIIEVNADHRYDLKSLRTWPGKPEWTAMITPDTSPWARKPAGYGQTECMGMLTFNAIGGPGEGTSGRPSPVCQVRVVDPDGVEVPLGETGEIVARGLTMMNGYFNRDDLNGQRLAGEWHHTNDLGRREADGSLTFVAPKTRIVKSAAENIYPAEVEACIAKHPAVKECAIIGVPDPKWTQSVKAIVVLKDGETATADDIVEHCRAAIASYKKPRTVEFVAALPRQGWAVDYDELDARFGGGGYPGGTNRSA
jgi:acyl-CoA synthetase (AMP-forming)/AMP-acid ligase II